MAAEDLFAILAIVVTLAVAAETIGARFGVPNFLLFSVAGIAIGPPGLGFVNYESFGEGLAILVGIAVAIIIFHSGSGITVEMLRGAPRMAYLLATVGTLVTFLGTATLTYVIMDVRLGVALLIGALLVPTGTTVIEPLLSAIPLPDHIAYPLEIEALVTEVTAGILAISVFYGITLGPRDPGEFAIVFLGHLGAGLLVGTAIAGVVWFLFNYPTHAPAKAPEHASQLYLGTAIVAFAVAENVAKEAGVAAVAVAGLILGNANLPYREHIADFKDDFVTFILAFVFVTLASFVEPDWLVRVGVDGLLVAVGVVVVVRPLAILLATAGSVLSVREKLFLSTVSPRGIIPAGLATLLAIDIQDLFPGVAADITGTVLLVILLTTLVEGVLAARAAEWLGVTAEAVVVVGGGRLGLALADQYAEQGDRVHVVETDHELVQTARVAGFPTHHGDGTDEAVARRAGFDRATRLVAATDDDQTNREVARLARSEFDVETVLVRLNQGDNRTLFEDLDVELLTGAQLEIWALEHLVDPSAPDWLTAVTRTGGVATATATQATEGTTVLDLDGSLPDRSFVVALTRDGNTWVPEGSEPVEYGDRVTVIGTAEAVDEATARVDPLAHGERAGATAPSDPGDRSG